MTLQRYAFGAAYASQSITLFPKKTKINNVRANNGFLLTVIHASCIIFRHFLYPNMAITTYRAYRLPLKGISL